MSKSAEIPKPNFYRSDRNRSGTVQTETKPVPYRLNHNPSGTRFLIFKKFGIRYWRYRYPSVICLVPYRLESNWYDRCILVRYSLPLLCLKKYPVPTSSVPVLYWAHPYDCDFLVQLMKQTTEIRLVKIRIFSVITFVSVNQKTFYYL